MTQIPVATSKLRVAFIAPCIGVGGADALMLGLIKYAYNLEFVGMAIIGPITLEQYQWAHNVIGESVPIHQVNCNQPKIAAISYYQTREETIYEATRDADIIITWSCENLESCFRNIDKPIVELAQNGDQYTRNIVDSNKNVVDFRVGCANWVTSLFEPYTADAVIYNGIDPGRIVPRYGVDLTRQSWGLKPNEKVLLFMGRFVEEKYPQSVIQALQHLPDDWIGLFVGSGYREDELYREAQRYLSPGRVRFMPPQYHVGDILAASDCFLLVSDFEGLSLATLEAWFAGLPTVLSRNESIKEIEQRVGHNFLHTVPVRATSEDIASAILRAVDDVQSALFARDLAWKAFTLPTIAVQWEEFLYQAWPLWHRRRLKPSMYKTDPPQPISTSKSITYVHKST